MSTENNRKNLVSILKLVSTLIGALIAFFGGNAAAMCLINNVL